MSPCSNVGPFSASTLHVHKATCAQGEINSKCNMSLLGQMYVTHFRQGGNEDYDGYETR